MEYTQETQLILNSLGKDRKELADKLSEIDKLIKKIRYGNVNLGASKGMKENITDEIGTTEEVKPFPLKADLKVQVIKILNILGEASKLNAVQEKYKELTGYQANLRETLRNLNKHQILKLLQPKNHVRGLYWVKTEWLEDNETKLQDKYKFEGFDLLFSDDMVEYK